MSGEDEEAATAIALGFPPYRRSPLKSKTYQLLNQLLSLFDQQAPGQETQEKEPSRVSEPIRATEDPGIEEGEISDNAAEIDVLEEEKCNVEEAHANFSGELKHKDLWSELLLKQVEEKKRELDRRKTCEYNDIYGDDIGTWDGSRRGRKAKVVGKAEDSRRPGVVKEKVVKERVEKEKDANLASVKGVEAGVTRKRVVTEARRAKKKAKRRKERAEQNKRDGVKRLKLQTIVKAKKVQDCKYYLRGKCQQGDSCKFSHDLTPLTKSEPCKFFPLQRCLRGDDCPYDHELSKYPCDSFKSKGFCPRGDTCLFSHKVPLMNASSPASDINKKAQENSSLQGSANLGKQPNKGSTFQQTPNVSKSLTPRTPASLGTITRNLGQNVAELKPPAQAPKGISFLSFGKASCDDSTPQQKGKLPAASDDGAAVCNIGQGVSEKSHNSNEVLGGTPASTLSFQPSKTAADGQNKNVPKSARRTPSSMSEFASKYVSKMQPSPASQLAPKYEPKMMDPGATASTGITTISNILQEFLFNGQ